MEPVLSKVEVLGMTNDANRYSLIVTLRSQTPHQGEDSTEKPAGRDTIAVFVFLLCLGLPRGAGECFQPRMLHNLHDV